MFNNLFSKFQVFGKAIMLPIAVLPAAGLLLGIGGAFSNPATIENYPFLDLVWLQAIFTIMSSAGQIIFSNLPIIFAIGIAVGLAKSDKGVAGLAAILSYFVMNATINAMLQITGKLATENLAGAGQGMTVGIQTLQSGVFGGVIAGLLTVYLHGKFGKVQLPQFLGFFSGSRFIPIITAFMSIFLGVAMFFVWPPIQSGIASMSDLVDKTAYFGTFLFGFIVKLLGPLGLHHVFYLPFWQTGLGGTMTVNGEVIQGAQNIFFAQLADPNLEHFFVGTSRFMSGKYLPMMFGLLGAALAMYHTAKPEHKKVVGGLLFTGALTSFLTGITEPLEFTFLFVAPVLYVIHAALWGVAYVAAHLLNITIGMTFSAGLIDFTLFGILQGNDKTNWILVPIVGILFFLVYYVVFRFMIVKFNLKTPGREDEELEETTIAGSERAQAIIAALGGGENIEDVDNCATRLRVTVKDGDKVSEEQLKKSGAKGVFVKGQGVQAIYGPHVTIIKTEVEEGLGD
ncbi:glucose-specific PTS transporter subunit IIBC [Gracilibacillus dipsosauri]|uniref:PTS glucose transporter subunit IIB n=1 Tax=Gracilibacillus dipsosauri TaxID=178340 RepID=A0A317KWC8_9BACI|nr:glucose-specific PTS transporter subunit IIBC [Gracilibacillus dipsosauri]PWU66748.1 PTS glucose transporter subunit IIB [Gracilibacillus dipsosauri]